VIDAVVVQVQIEHAESMRGIHREEQPFAVREIGERLDRD
jgi:hypothetical protein